MVKNTPEAMQRVVEKLIIDILLYEDCSDWDCSECPCYLKESVEDPRYGTHNCGWLLLESAIIKILTR